MADKAPDPQTHTESSPASAATAGKGNDPRLDMKKRARRRLVGAIALALLAIIVLPMVMDQEPRPAASNVQIRIPSQDPGSNTVISRITPGTPAPNISTAASAAPSTDDEAPSADEAAAHSQAAAEPAGANATPATPATAAKPAENKKPAPPEPGHDDKVPPKPTAHADKPATKSAETERAEAILNDERWIIQLGAYQNAGNVKLLQSKIKELGYAVFTEKIDTPNGARIRVRCGPFASREAAEKAQLRLKKIAAGGPGGGTVAQVK